MKIQGSIGTPFTPPQIEDDLYDATIADLCEPYTETDPYNPGKERTRMWVDWQIGDDTLRQWINLPDGMLGDPPALSPKSTMYSLLEALGFVGDGGFKFDTDTWMGRKARVMVENKPDTNGGMRPYITGVKPPRATQPTAAKRQPVGLRQRLQPEE